MGRAGKLLVAAAAAMLVAITATSARAATVPGCTPARNIEAIIDDSGSMSGTDPWFMRRSALGLLIASPANANRILGAIDYGTPPAERVFSPGPIGRYSKAMIAALNASIQADNGSTDYDWAFAKAALENPSADARIFLTDSPNNGNYLDSHRGGPKTYVVGLGIGAPSPANEAGTRLTRIAAETGGTYFPVVGPEQVQPTVNRISAAIGCLREPRSYTSGRFTHGGQSSRRGARLARSTRRIDLALNWSRPHNRFSLSAVQVLDRHGRVLATLTGKGRPKKLSFTRSRAKTFQLLSIKKPRGASKLRFRVSARRVPIPERTIGQLTQR